MGWEYRGSSGPYYTRSKRVRGRVVREYVGGGTFGQALALADEEEREERLAVREGELRRRREIEDAERLLDDFCEGTEILARSLLYAGGYHRHKKGEWRRRRVKAEETQAR